MKKKCFLICEPPNVNTGFGIVSQVLAKALTAEFDTMLFATGGRGNSVLTPDLFSDWHFKSACTTFQDNAHGTNFIDMKLREYEPHVVFMYYDTGSIAEYITKTHVTTWPTAAYMMVEGQPLMYMWRRMFKDIGYIQGLSPFDWTIDDILLPSETAVQDVIKETGRECDFARHGGDHANFRKMPGSLKKELREQLALDCQDASLKDAFIFLYNARNVERKAWPRLFRALKLAQDLCPERKIKLLGHTKVFDNFKLGGWALNEEAEKAGLSKDSIIWTMPVNDAEAPNKDHNMPFDVPDDSKVTSLIKLYNTADAYIHPSCVEAAGIPIIEAARCGLPVLTTDYSSGGEYGKLCGAVPLPVHDWWYHSSGMEHALIDIKQTAEIMVKLVRNEAWQHQLSAASLKGSSTLTWDTLATKCVESAERAIKSVERKNLAILNA